METDNDTVTKDFENVEIPFKEIIFKSSYDAVADMRIGRNVGNSFDSAWDIL